jgi:hypothetical protein
MAALTVDDIITASNALFITVPGIKRTFQEAPDTPPSGSGDLPCVIPIVEGNRPSFQAFGYRRRDYTIKFIVLIATYSKGLISIEKQARPFMDNIDDVFAPHVKLNNPDIDHADLTDLQYTRIEYTPGGAIYVGIIATMNATIKKVIAMSAN